MDADLGDILRYDGWLASNIEVVAVQKDANIRREVRHGPIPLPSNKSEAEPETRTACHPCSGREVTSPSSLVSERHCKPVRIRMAMHF